MSGSYGKRSQLSSKDGECVTLFSRYGAFYGFVSLIVGYEEELDLDSSYVGDGKGDCGIRIKSHRDFGTLRTCDCGSKLSMD